MNYIFVHHVNFLLAAVGVITLAITFIFIIQGLILAVTCITQTLVSLEELHNALVQYARKVFIVPWIII